MHSSRRCLSCGCIWNKNCLCVHLAERLLFIIIYSCSWSFFLYITEVFSDMLNLPTGNSFFSTSFSTLPTILFNIKKKKKNLKSQNLKNNSLYFQSEFCSVMLSWSFVYTGEVWCTWFLSYCHLCNLGELCRWYHHLLKLCYVGYFVLGTLIFTRKYWWLFEKTWYPLVTNHYKMFCIDALIINMTWRAFFILLARLLFIHSTNIY